MTRVYKRAAIIVAISLIIVISYTLRWKPEEQTTHEIVYNGSLWRGMIPVEYLSYKAIEGTLHYDKVPTPRQFISGTDYFETRIVNMTTYTLKTADTESVYYLVTNEHKPIVDNRYLDLLDFSTVYVYGNFFNYLAPDGNIMKMIEPIEISSNPVLDLVDASKNIIIDIVGEDYYASYFSSPVLWKDEWDPTRMYTVEYIYKCEAQRDQSIRSVSLTFNSDRRLFDQTGIPDSLSVQPFKINQNKAITIARENGFPAQGEPKVYIVTYTHPSEQGSLSDSITLTIIDPQNCAKLVELSHYLWCVELVTAAQGSYPEVHTYAIIDVNTGEFYQLGEFRVLASGSTD